MLQCEEAKASNRFPGLFSKGMINGSLYRVRVRAGSGIRPEGWLRWSAHRLGGALWRAHAQHPAFAPDSSEVEVVFLVFLYLVWFASTAWACAELFSVPYSFFVFCCRGSQATGSSLSHFLYLFFHLSVHVSLYLEESLATHSSILAWRIPRAEEPGGLQSIGLQRMGHGWIDLACTHTQAYTTHILSLTQVTITSVPKLLCFHT